MYKIYIGQHLKQLKNMVLSVVALFVVTAGFAQNERKLAPALRYLLDHKSDTSATFRKQTPSLYVIEPKEGFASKGAPLEKRYDCIVYTKNAQALKSKGIVINSTLPTFVTAWATMDQITEMANMADVAYIENPAIDGLHNDIALGTTGASLLHAGKLNNTVYKGKGVIVAVFDSGIDWQHYDFRDPVDPTKSRILRMWDQTITATSGEAPPTGFSYGVEYTQSQINDQLNGSPSVFIREQDVNGHGTHVAGTAAGNGASLASKKYTGMAPEADLIIIKGGNGSFPTTNTVDALTYLKGLANTLGKPIVLNMSIGGQSGPHDGTRSHELAVDDFTSSGPGRVVVISAGNDNGTNIHNKYILAAGASNTTSFTVPSFTTGSDIFQYTVYASTNGTVTATVTAPDLTTTTGGSIMGGAFTANVTNAVDAVNNQRYVNLYITRPSGSTSPGGQWSLTITNTSASSITFDGWLNYKSTVFTNTTLNGGDNVSLVGSPGNATSAITAAAYTGRNTWYSNGANNGYQYSSGAYQDDIASFSSLGPRRDGYQKPDIAAHGQAVVSCMSSNMSPAATASDVVEVGLYMKEQGTSMASPVTAGACALLLQAMPTATVTQIKSLITSNANKDDQTEAPGVTPNTTWGYGKLDVFKAASSAFGCAPAKRNTYLYDYQGLPNQNTSAAFTSTRVAVRFTTDIAGKLAGIYYHTSTTVTSLVAEIRTNLGGSPGLLLGTISLPDTKVAKYSWNYVDFSSLNISLANATDYFAIIYRDPSSSAGWSMVRENTAWDNRTVTSTDGVTWTSAVFDYKIRAVVYNNSQSSGAIATVNSIDTRNINTSNQFINSSCQLIAQDVPNGAVPVTGSVATNVWIESSVPAVNGKPYVARHYQIIPATNTTTATGRITLYFTQAEFNAFNSHVGSTLDLPTGTADATGKANLRVGQFAGSSSNGTGLVTTYNGAVTVIDPVDSDILWNAEFSRWEVTFNATGAGGFVLQTLTTPLPITVEYFKGNKQADKNMLSWKVLCDGNSLKFGIERSSDAVNFSSIGTLSTVAANCGQPFNFTDALPLAGKNYYRIKITEENGRSYYTNIIMLQNDKAGISNLYPTVITKGENISVAFAGSKGSLLISDAIGRNVFTQTLVQGTQSIQPSLKTSGTYFFTITDTNEKTIVAKGKIIVQ